MAKARVLVIYCYVFCAFHTVWAGFTTTKISPQPLWNSTYTDKLRHDLLLNYDKFARPAEHYNVTTVEFGLVIKHIEINEFKSTMTVHSWLNLGWNDEKLKWNSSEYGKLGSLTLADHEIWQPDIHLFNSATSMGINHYGTAHSLAYPDGQILWVPPVQFTVLCDFNLKYWPFDSQQCKMVFGSWTYSAEQIDLQIKDNYTEAKVELFIENSEWDIKGTSLVRNLMYYTCCKEAYTDIEVNIIIQRRSPSYKALIITPAFVIIILTLLSFWLPPQAGEKIILNGCTAIIISVFMLYFTQKIPAMGTHTPLIVLFYSSCLYINGFSMIGAVVVIWVSRTKHFRCVPWIIKQPLTGKFGKILGLHAYILQTNMISHKVTADEMRDHQVTDMDENISGDEHHIIRTSNKSHLQQDWILLAAAIDRISFYFYSFLFAILSIVYSV